MHVDIVVEQERQLRETGHIVSRRWRLGLADDDTAAECAAIVEDAVVGDFQIMAPTVYEDATAPLGTIGNAQTIDPRWVAQEVGDVELGRGVAVAQTIVEPIVGDCTGTAVERDTACHRLGRGAAVGSIVVLQAFGQNGNRRAFVGAHQGGLLQKLCDIAIEAGVPANNRLEGDRIDLALHRRSAGERTGGIVGMRAGDVAAVQSQSEQAVHALPPRLEQLACRVRVGVNDDRRRANAL